MKKLVPLIILTLVLVSCGKSTPEDNTLTVSAIINGTLTTDTDLASKSTVALTDPTANSPYCSGTLISENLISTNAHCVSTWTPKSLFKSSKRITKQANVTFKLNSSETVTRLKITNVEMYPAKDFEEAYYHDIAIVKFEGTIPKEFKPVAILDPEYTITENTELLVAGFGMQSNSDWSDALVSKQIKVPYLGSQQNILILNQLNGKNGVYHGDSGGPAYFETEQELFLTGSTMGGQDGETKAYFVQVSAYKKFILEASVKLKATPPVFKMPAQ